MKKVDMYEIEEEVLVKAKVIGMVIDDGQIKYKLKNTINGRDYDHLFKADQLIPITPEPVPKPLVNNTRPLMKDKH